MRSRIGQDSAVTEDAALLFRALLAQGRIAVGVVDGTGRLTLMSRGLQEMVGTSSVGMTSEDFPRVFHLYDAEGRALLRPEDVPVTRAVTGQTVRDVVISVRRPGEPVRYLRCDAMPLDGPDGTRTGAIVLVVDITAERTAQSRQDSIRSLLLDTVNHEMRTPLTVVLANAELLDDAADELPEHLRAPLDAIARASGRLRDTVQHVTDLVDLEALAHTVTSHSQIADLLNAVADRHRDRAARRAISVEVEASESLGWYLDPRLVTKAVSALLDNALTYGPSDSTVTLTAEVVDDLLRVCVNDSGEGIPIDDQERLTKPFERGRTLADDPRPGRGLGLAYAQAVATSHHGVLLLTPQYPQGFAACMMLP
jgi:signal transduction histidine kinase